MRWLSPRHAMCRSRKPRLRAVKQRAAQQRRADAVTLPRFLHADRGFGLARKSHAERPQFRGAAHRAADEKAVHDRVEAGGQIDVIADEVVGHAAGEPIVPALGIETQHMLAVCCRLRRSTICGLRRLREGLRALGLLTLSSIRPSFSLPPRKRAVHEHFALAAESKHHVVWRGNLARQSIEQHAHIPYTHGFQRVYDELTTRNSPNRRHADCKAARVNVQSATFTATFPHQSSAQLTESHGEFDHSAIRRRRRRTAASSATTRSSSCVEMLARLEARIAEYRLARKSSSLGWLFANREKQAAAHQGPLHLRRRRPRQDHADGLVLRGEPGRAQAPRAFSRIHDRRARARSCAPAEDETSASMPAKIRSSSSPTSWPTRPGCFASTNSTSPTSPTP